MGTATPTDDGSADTDGDVASGGGMTAANLREQVLAARMARRWSAIALQRASGLSARTLRDIENGRPGRRYSVTTLAALDRALGWEEGRAWRIWTENEPRPETPVEELLEQMEQLRAAVTHLGETAAAHEDRPAWADELVGLVAALNADDRRLVFDLAERLARPHG